VVEQSAHDDMFKGLNPAAFDTGREEIETKNVFLNAHTELYPLRMK
jgi:hypothetical protein